MSNNGTNTADHLFPSISPEMVNRLGSEVEHRTSPPEAIDWEEIHRRAHLGMAKAKSAEAVPCIDEVPSRKLSHRLKRRFGLFQTPRRGFL